nr:thermostable hemolysin [uncultured Limnobacter sp.]
MKPVEYNTRQHHTWLLSVIQEPCADSKIRQFIADIFMNHYGATIESYCDRLIGVCSPQGTMLAAAGYNLAEEGPLFLEQYLDSPLEQQIQQQLDMDITRSEIAEVGNLAALQAGGARMLIELMTQRLHQEGRRWVAFTATKSLINSFHRMGLSPVILAPANPERVKNPNAWGSYYLQNPYVAIGDIQLGHARLGGQQ